MKNLKIAIGSDHAGFNLKNTVIEYLESKGYGYKDYGCYSAESYDYPVAAHTVAKAVAAKEFDLGILVCGSGQGMSIVANKTKGIRAVTCAETFSAHSTRTHNDANILCLGERIIGKGLALDIVEIWLTSEFEGGRHQKRVDMFESCGQ